MTSNKGKTFLFVGIIAAMIVPITGDGIGDVFATNKAIDDLTDKEKKMRQIEELTIKAVKQTSKSDISRIHENIMSDQKVMDITKDKELKFNAHSYHGNLNELEQNPNKPLNIIMHYTLDDKPFTVKVDRETNNILSVYESSVGGKLLPNHAIVMKYLNTGGPTINGLRMDMASPDFDEAPLTNWTALLLNAQVAGSTGDICDADDFPDAYWAQVGLRFVPNGKIEIVWADTTTDCNAQVFESDVGSAHDLTFWIQTESQIDKWAIYAYDYDTSEFYPQIVDDISASENIATGTTLTNVFFENPTSTPNNGWSVGFNEDPTVDSAYSRTTSSGAWNYWYGEVTHDNKCYPGNEDPADYMSGNLQTGLTFDVALIDEDCATDTS